MSDFIPEKKSAPAAIDAGKTLPWLVYLIFFAVLNETVFNVSTPAIASRFDLSPAGVSWVMTAFIVFFAMGSVIYGRLSDIFSLKRLILIGVSLYAGGSALGFLLQSFYPGVILARTVQGAGASALPALIMILIARYFPAEVRGRVFGTITSVIAFAAGVGPVIGGFVSGSVGWPFLFLIPLLTLVSIPFFLRLLPEEGRRKGGVDILGALFTAAGITALILFLSFPAWYYLAACAASVGALVFHIRRVQDPFINPALFRNVKFRAGIVVGFLVFSSCIGVVFLIPLMLAAVHGAGTREIGLLMFPGAISGVVFGRLGGSLADRRGNGAVMALGLALLVVSLFSLSLILGLGAWLISASLLVTYIGFTLIQTGLVNSVSQTLPVEQTGVGMGLFNLITFISAAIGTAFVARVLASGWLSVKPNPVVAQKDAFVYANLMVVFSVLILAGGAVYFARFRKKSAESALGGGRPDEAPDSSRPSVRECTEAPCA